MKKTFLWLTIVSALLTVAGVVYVAASKGSASPLLAVAPSVLSLIFYTLMKKQ